MKTKSGKFSRTSLVAGLLLGALPFSAYAWHSDDFTVWDGQGNVREYVQVTEAQEVANGPDFVYRLNTPVDPQQFGNFTTLYDDPNNPRTSVGDIFGIAFDSSGFFLAFSSDTDNALPFGGGFASDTRNFYEGSAAAFDATMYLAIDLQDAGWTAAFRSDNALNGIPEPTSLSLVALGAFGLLASRRRKKIAA